MCLSMLCRARWSNCRALLVRVFGVAPWRLAWALGRWHGEAVGDYEQCSEWQVPYRCESVVVCCLVGRLSRLSHVGLEGGVLVRLGRVHCQGSKVEIARVCIHLIEHVVGREASTLQCVVHQCVDGELASRCVGMGLRRWGRADGGLQLGCVSPSLFRGRLCLLGSTFLLFLPDGPRWAWLRLEPQSSGFVCAQHELDHGWVGGREDDLGLVVHDVVHSQSFLVLFRSFVPWHLDGSAEAHWERDLDVVGIGEFVLFGDLGDDVWERDTCVGYLVEVRISFGVAHPFVGHLEPCLGDARLLPGCLCLFSCVSIEPLGCEC